MILEKEVLEWFRSFAYDALAATGSSGEEEFKDQRAWRLTVSGCVLAVLTAIGSM